MSKYKDPSAIENQIFHKDDLTFRIIEIIDQEKDLNRSLQQVCDTIAGNSHLKNTVSARISFNQQFIQSQQFEETSVVVKHDFKLPDGKKGFVELFLSPQSITFPSGSVIDEAESTLKMIATLLVGKNSARTANL